MPKGAPPAIVARLNAELIRISRLPSVLEKDQGPGHRP